MKPSSTILGAVLLLGHFNFFAKAESTNVHVGAYVDEVHCSLENFSTIMLTSKPDEKNGLNKAVVITSGKQCACIVTIVDGKTGDQRKIDADIHETKVKGHDILVMGVVTSHSSDDLKICL